MGIDFHLKYLRAKSGFLLINVHRCALSFIVSSFNGNGPFRILQQHNRLFLQKKTVNQNKVSSTFK